MNTETRIAEIKVLIHTLETELKRLEKPTQLPACSTINIRRACENYIDFISEDDCNRDKVGDYENEIFEVALKMVYGPDVFDYVNAKLD